MPKYTFLSSRPCLSYDCKPTGFLAAFYDKDPADTIYFSYLCISFSVLSVCNHRHTYRNMNQEDSHICSCRDIRRAFYIHPHLHKIKYNSSKQRFFFFGTIFMVVVSLVSFNLRKFIFSLEEILSKATHNINICKQRCVLPLLSHNNRRKI